MSGTVERAREGSARTPRTRKRGGNERASEVVMWSGPTYAGRRDEGQPLGALVFPCMELPEKGEGNVIARRRR
jgi:hypothetical protein